MKNISEKIIAAEKEISTQEEYYSKLYEQHPEFEKQNVENRKKLKEIIFNL